MPGKSGSHDVQKNKLAAFGQRQKRHFEFQPIAVRAKNGANGNRKPMRFVSLHHHSTFSFLDGFQLPESHVRRAAELQMPALAMTEHGNIFSHVKLEKAAEELGIKPIFGCEFYVGWTDDRRAQKKNHITVIAKDAEGYRNLLTLVQRSWREGFYYEPTVDWNWLTEHQKGLVILSGCSGSALFTAAVGGKHVGEDQAGPERALRVARWMANRFDDFYIEVQAFPELERTRLANPILADCAQQLGTPLVATMDCHYTIPEESEIQKVLHGVRPGERRTVEELEQSWGYDVPLCPPINDADILTRLKLTGLTQDQALEAIASTEEIAQACSVTLPRLPHVDFPLPEGYHSPRDLWRDWLREGWRYRGCHELPREERERYKAQLKREMEVIEAKGYENYFLIVADAIRYSKDQQIPVGPARGSAAASLACWLLRITEVNPMDFDYLVFERFIDWSREDMPDIDIDFATYGRPILREYLEEKYGEGCVNNIGTFTMYKSKNSLDDAARVHEVPIREVERVKELLLDRSSGDLRASATIEDTVNQFDQAYEVFEKHPELTTAMDLEGNVRGWGVHAAGVVISSEPIDNITARVEKEVPKGSGRFIDVIAMDMKDAERQGMEKIDLLSLSTMDMIADAIRMLDMSVEELYKIPFDDPVVYKGFQRNDVVGVFQFDGEATRMVNSQIKPDNFDEMALIIAIARPGPLHNGAVEGYVNVKYGDAGERESIHPALDRITEVTNYQIIFQEQIIRIVREIGNFDWTGAATIRKIIAKKKGEQEFNRQWDTFREGALKLHEREPDLPPIDAATAKHIWMMCITAGAYAFNAAHSVSYGKISYWTMWLKVHHPAVFYAASLPRTKDDDRFAAMLRDAAKHGIDVRPPALNSGITWQPEGERAIRAGLEQVPGIGTRTATKIAEAGREMGGFSSFDQLLAIPNIGPKKIETIQSFCEQSDPFRIMALDEAIEEAVEAIEAGLKDTAGKPLPEPTHTAQEIIEAPGNERIVFLGVPTKRNLRDLYEANQKKGEEVDWENIKRPDLAQWVVMPVRDGDEMVTAIVSRFRYPKFKDVIWKIQPGKDLVLLKCKKARLNGMGERSGVVFVDDIWVLGT
jgi:Zierdtviridae DNA polymerase